MSSLMPLVIERLVTDEERLADWGEVIRSLGSWLLGYLGRVIIELRRIL